MADRMGWWARGAEQAGAPVLFRRFADTSTELDMTPMIDCTFLLLVFFLVGSMPDLQTAVRLPPARYGTAANPRTSVIITVAERGEGQPAAVYLADGKVGTPLPDDPEAQERLVHQAVVSGQQQGKNGVLIKAERGVRHSEVSRIATAAGRTEGMRLYLAVMEAD